MSDKGDGLDLPAEFADAVRRFTLAREEIAQEAARRSYEAARGYAQRVQEVQRQSQSVVGGDYQEWIRSSQTAAQEAYRRWQEAARAYQEESQASAEGFVRGQEQAFREYVANLQKAWADVDPATIDRAAIAAIQHAMIAAAVTPRSRPPTSGSES